MLSCVSWKRRGPAAIAVMGLTGALVFAQTEKVTPPKCNTSAKPYYSRNAVAAKLEGVVILSALVKRDGVVGDVTVVKGLGMGLDEKAVESAQFWKCTPGERNGARVDLPITVETVFRIGAGGNPLLVSGQEASANLMSKTAPVFPGAARREQTEGIVTLEAIIGTDGRVRKVTLISGNPFFNVEAAAALKQWRYRPFVIGEVPVEVATTVTITFRLNN